jgi:hypothetical protein
MNDTLDYDGIYFLPDGSGGYNLAYFLYDGEYKQEKRIKDDVYHIVFFYDDEEGNAKFDETFEAIFLHPESYLKTLVGSKFYGVITKKTQKSLGWINKFIDNVLTSK